MQKSDLNERFQPARPKLDNDEQVKTRVPLALVKLLPFTDDPAKMLRFEAQFLEE